MSIKVRYFASLKDQVGRSEDQLQVLAPISVQAVWQQLNPQLTMPQTLLAAINMEYVDLDTMVEDGDELAFFPPVTGG
jgi:molybdopterin synthase sulfur carrier subunit